MSDQGSSADLLIDAGELVKNLASLRIKTPIPQPWNGHPETDCMDSYSPPKGLEEGTQWEERRSQRQSSSEEQKEEYSSQRSSQNQMGIKDKNHSVDNPQKGDQEMISSTTGATRNPYHGASQFAENPPYRPGTPRPNLNKDSHHDSFNTIGSFPKHQPQGRQGRSPLSVSNLIHILLNFSAYRASTQNIRFKCGLDDKEVIHVASMNRNIFDLEGDLISLRPKLKMCRNHQSKDGCLNKAKCTDLHICSNFVNNRCSNLGCIYGHSLETKHNKVILRGFMIDEIPLKILCKVIGLSLTTSKSVNGFEICHDYNVGRCDRRENCHNLHICRTFLLNQLVCKKPPCNLNHIFTSLNNPKIFRAHGIDVNESPRDILKTLQEQYPSLFKQLQTRFQNLLDFSTMTQTNLKTNVVREVKRRPAPHLQQKPGIFQQMQHMLWKP